MKMDRHHLLEIILWPNDDGTFREIRNSKARLKELGIYDDYKMCIKISTGEHASLHQKGDCNNSNWRGDNATEATKKRRHCNSRDPELRRLRRAKRKAAAQLRAAAEVRPN